MLEGTLKYLPHSQPFSKGSLLLVGSILCAFYNLSICLFAIECDSLCIIDTNPISAVCMPSNYFLPFCVMISYFPNGIIWRTRVFKLCEFSDFSILVFPWLWFACHIKDLPLSRLRCEDLMFLCRRVLVLHSNLMWYKWSKSKTSFCFVAYPVDLGTIFKRNIISLSCFNGVANINK